MPPIIVNSVIIPSAANKAEDNELELVFSVYFTFRFQGAVPAEIHTSYKEFPSLVDKLSFKLVIGNYKSGSFSVNPWRLFWGNEWEVEDVAKRWESIFQDPKVVPADPPAEEKLIPGPRAIAYMEGTDVIIEQHDNLYREQLFHLNKLDSGTKDLKASITERLKAVETIKNSNKLLLEDMVVEQMPEKLIGQMEEKIYFNELVSYCGDLDELESLVILNRRIKKKVPLEKMPPSGTIGLEVTGRDGKVFQFTKTNIPTAYELKGKEFRPRPFSDRIRDGYLQLQQTERFQLLQTNAAGATFRSALIEKSLDNDEGPVLPGMTSNGFYLIEKLPQKDKDFLKGQVEGQSRTELYLEDLMAGVRFDVRRTKSNGEKEAWKSLHQTGSSDWGQYVQIDQLTEGNSYRIKADFICHYTGWHLNAPHPLNKTPAETEEPPATNSAVEDYMAKKGFTGRQSGAPKGLPLLRFNDHYEFRGRIVTLEGNSLDKDDRTDAYATAEVPYLRLEATPPPVLVPRETLKTKDPKSGAEHPAKGREGESEELLVIRAAGAGDTRQQSKRGVAPGAISWQHAEWHGAFDRGGKPDVSKLMQISSFVPRFKNGEWIEGTGKFLPGKDTRKTVPYLADPLCQGFEIICDAHPAYSVLFEDHPGLLFFEQEEDWPKNVRLWNIVVQEAQCSDEKAGDFKCHFRVVAGERTIYYFLPKGEELVLKIRSFPVEQQRINLDPGKSGLKLLDGFARSPALGVWKNKMAQTAAVPNSYGRLLRSNHLFGEKEFRLLHAVKKPLAAPAFDGPTTVQRTWKQDQQNRALITSSIFFPGRTAGNMELLAEWTDEVDVPLDEQGHVHNQLKRVAFNRSVVWEYLLQAKITKKTNSPWDLGQVEAYEGESGIPGDLTKTFYAVHDLPDTKARKITYSLRALSRFQEFYPESTRDEAFEVFSKGLEVLLPASKAPAAPKVAFITPLAERVWSSEGFSQKGYKVRLILERPWGDSGIGEQLAVLVSTDPQRAEDSAYTPFISSAGRDITTFGKNMAPLQPLHFANALSVVNDLTIDHPGFKTRDQLLASQQVRTGFTAMVYDVKPYPSPSNFQYYSCDIYLQGVGSYFPFLQLAIARYQPNSIRYEELSAPLLCGFTQVAPDRSVTVKVSGGNLDVSFFANTVKLARRDPGEARVVNRVFLALVPQSRANPDSSHAVVYHLGEVPEEQKGVYQWIEIPNPALVEESALWRIQIKKPEGNYKLILKEYEAFANHEGRNGNPDDDANFRLVSGTTMNV